MPRNIIIESLSDTPVEEQQVELVERKERPRRKKKEEAKQKATALQGEAKTAIEDAKKLLAKAPKGKGTKADIEAMKADVKGLADGLAEFQKLFDAGNYLDAVNKAQAIKDKAASVSEQVKSAMAKTGKPGKK